MRDTLITDVAKAMQAAQMASGDVQEVQRALQSKTLLDEFALAAMQCVYMIVIADSPLVAPSAACIADACYAQAAEMLAAKERAAA